MTGKIKWYDKKKGFGFIIMGADDIFFHHSAIVGDYDPLENDKVEFSVTQGKKGQQASNVTRA